MFTFEGALPFTASTAALTAAAVCLDAVEFVRTKLGLNPDDQQQQVLRSQAKRGILNCSRQWGKSTILAAKAVHRAFTQRAKLVLVASPSARQSTEFIRKASEMLRLLGIEPRGDGVNKGSLVLPNGSRIVGLPGKEATVRGFSAVSLLLFDEAARVDDAMYKALRPTLAVGNGDLWMMSTPRGKRGFFHDRWMFGGPDWFKLSAPATANPRIPKEFLEEERSEMGSMWFQQEYLCEFVDSGLGVFHQALVEAALDETVKRLNVGTWD